MAGAATKDFTKGSIPKKLFWFMIPFMLSNALQVFYSTIDMIIVGKYVGTAGLSAVAQSSQIVNFAAFVCLGIANAGQVLISQAIGGGKRDKITSIFSTLFYMVMALAAALSALFLVFRYPVLHILKMPAESLGMGGEYLAICGGGLVFTAGYNMVSAVLRGMGDSKRPLLFIGIASVINLVLDYVFTGLWGWGVRGAAWATVIGQGVSFLFSVYYLYKKREAFSLDFKKENLSPDKAYAGMILRLGIPMAIQSGVINISMLFVSAIINSVGVVASATFGVGLRIDDMVNKLSLGIQYAVVPMVSQNIGAGEKERAKKVVRWSLVYSLVFTTFCMALYGGFGKELFMIFSDDPLVHDMAGTFIKGILWLFPALAVMRGTSGFIQGIGNARLGLVLSMLDAVVLRIGLAWLFGLGLRMGFYGAVLGYALAPYGVAVPGLIYFLSAKWEKRRTLAEEL
ncbi:MAG: MATE family efflux transporter [Clostridia bacterium]|nr:MATE family efflux transporter [Clostridia bacterium]